MTYLIFETTPMIPIFSSQKYLTNMQIQRSYDKKLTNDYESPKLVTCGWNSLSELRPLYLLKSNPPSISHQISSQESKLFYKPKRLAKKIHFKKMKKHFIWNLSFFSIVPMLIRKLPLGIKNQYIVLSNKRMQFGVICHAYRTQSFQN